MTRCILAVAIALCLPAPARTEEQSPSAAGEKVAALQPDSHPRLFADRRDFEEIRKSMASSPDRRILMEAIETRARAILEEEPVARIKEGRRLLSVSRKALDRLLQLSMASRMTGDPVFAERALREMEAIAAFPDWNPSHFLDVAEMTMAMAIGYDWLHDRIPADARGRFADAILEKGLNPSLAQDWWWIDTGNNWNQVCHGGMVAGALAIAEVAPQTAAQIIDRAVRNLPHSMDESYNPNGSYPEGVGYWNYGTTYNVMLIDMIQNALGDDFGLLDQSGFSLTGDYYHSAHSPMGRPFSYADGRRGEGPARLSPTLFWLARAFNRPDWVSARIPWVGEDPSRTAKSSFSPLLLLWMQGAKPDASLKIPLDWEGKGTKPVAIHRGGWGAEDAYVGICAGTPASSHGHMDIGSFVFEAEGVAWAVDLGMQSYHDLESRGIALWDKKQNGQRWDVFRLGTFGHNTLTLNQQHQRVDGFATIASFSDDPTHPCSVVDMSSNYAGQAGRVHRGIQLFNRSHLIIRDRLEGLADDAGVRWAMTTPAEIKIESPRRAVLTRDKETLIAHLVEPAEARWEVIDISTGPQPWDAENPDMRQLVFRPQAGKHENLNLTVILETGRPGAPSPAQAKQWNLLAP